MNFLKLISILILFSEISYAQKTQNSTPGRFQLMQLGAMRRDQYLLDTATGNIWVRSCEVSGTSPDCKYSAWTKQDIVGINISSSEVIKKIKLIEDLEQKTDKKFDWNQFQEVKPDNTTKDE